MMTFRIPLLVSFLESVKQLLKLWKQNNKKIDMYFVFIILVTLNT